MKSIITQYKKAALAFSAVIAMGTSAVILAECKPCAVKQSIKDAQAAALAGEKPAAKPNKPARSEELDAVSICCEFCAQNGYCMSNVCNSCKSRELQISLVEVATAALAAASELAQMHELDVVPADENQERAAREALQDICPQFPADDSIDAKLQALFNCCVCTNQQLRCQGHEAEKCCKKIRHRLHDIEDLIGDASTASAGCCSTMEAQISDLNLSVAAVFALLTSVFDCTCT